MNGIKRYIQAPNDHFFLFGPRGTGKSTWLKQTYPDALIIDLLDNAMIRAYQAFPERLKTTILANPSNKVIIIDEVRKRQINHIFF